MPSLADYLLANTAGGNFGTMSPGEEAAAVTPGSVLDAAARNAYQAIQNQPSWLEQAAAVRAQSNPNSLRPTPAEIDFATNLVGPQALGIKAYHGSPHDFERFDIGKIGTGEGAQAYGHGLYFAEAEPVAREYRDALKWRGANWDDPQVVVANVLEGRIAKGDPKIALDELEKARAAQLKTWPDRPNAALDGAIELLRSGQPITGKSANPGKMYEVDINADPEHFLDWDKSLSEQSPQVQEKLLAIPEVAKQQKFQTEFLGSDKGLTGSGLYAAATQWLRGSQLSPVNPAAVTEKLREAGIPGIKYLDQGSRGSGAGTSNYVVFDDKLIDILKKYGIAAGIIPAAGAALDRQQQ